MIRWWTYLQKAKFIDLLSIDWVYLKPLKWLIQIRFRLELDQKFYERFKICRNWNSPNNPIFGRNISNEYLSICSRLIIIKKTEKLKIMNIVCSYIEYNLEAFFEFETLKQLSCNIIKWYGFGCWNHSIKLLIFCDWHNNGRRKPNREKKWKSKQKLQTETDDWWKQLCKVPII